ncbi:Hypothetical predicted protein, partial [Pelobates cultripes]
SLHKKPFCRVLMHPLSHPVAIEMLSGKIGTGSSTVASSALVTITSGNAHQFASPFGSLLIDPDGNTYLFIHQGLLKFVACLILGNTGLLRAFYNQLSSSSWEHGHLEHPAPIPMHGPNRLIGAWNNVWIPYRLL